MVKKITGRYLVPTEEDFEKDSSNQVLKNYLGIKSKKEIEALEAKELERAELELYDIYGIDHQFTVEDICNIHELWLGDIYPLAGKFRTVSMSKDGFLFAAPNFILRLMHDFEKKYLSKYTPCHFYSDADLITALSIVHIELIIIHPFREGNGRTARLLAALMALQANRPSLNFNSIDRTLNKDGFRYYIEAIHAGHGKNFKPMEEIFRQILKDSVI